MLGGRHFAHKIAKRERRKAARKATRAATSATRSTGAQHHPQQQQHGNVQGSSHGHAAVTAKRRKNGSTLKGSVVVYDGGASRDVGNDRAAAAAAGGGYAARPSSSSAQQRQASLHTSSGNSAKKATGASSAAQRRRVLQQRSDDDLLAHFRTRLSGSTFRLLNEQIYSSPTALVRRLLGDAATFADYHGGYAQQLAQWPVQPSALVVQCLLADKRGRFLGNKEKRLRGHIPRSWVVADMGCGDAHIAAALTPLGYTVHSFDLCALHNNPHVTVASTTAVPLPSASVDVCVFALSLMATDYVDSLYEAFRVLKPRRLLKIVEVRSRLPHPRRFAELVCDVGFALAYDDVVGGDYFVAFDFIKRDDVAQPQRTLRHDPNEVLVPSLYKKR